MVSLKNNPFAVFSGHCFVFKQFLPSKNILSVSFILVSSFFVFKETWI